MINYTIIIPHKNIPHLLVRCLNSIPQRDDIQVIVVDDNSDEKHLSELKKMLPLYPNFEFIFGKNENGRRGAGYARNLGLERAIGKWLVFADADDNFTSEINVAMDEYKDKEFDIVYFWLTAINEKAGKSSKRAIFTNYLMSVGKNGNIDRLKFQRVSVCGKFVSLRLVKDNNISFQERKVANDVWFSMMSAYYAKNIDVSDFEIYCLVEREGSLQFSKNFKRRKLYFDNDIEIFYQLKEYNLDKHFRGHIRYWWRKMARSNLFLALVYLPKMIMILDVPKLLNFFWNIMKKKNDE